jgi:cellulase/cellobiase CelA1
VSYTVANDWGSGATVSMDVINNGFAAIDGWTLAWTFPGNQQINNLWGGSYNQSGAAIAVTNASWNATIGANGGSVNFGFNLQYSGANEPPTQFTLNGVICGGGPPPTATPTQTPTATRPPTATPTEGPTATPTPGGATCAVDYTVVNDWGSGATVSVDIINHGSSPVDGWTLAWIFPGNQQITNLWGGTYTQSGALVSVNNALWNGTIPANGGTVNFGFNIEYSGSNAEPTSFRLNGVACRSR